MPRITAPATLTKTSLRAALARHHRRERMSDSQRRRSINATPTRRIARRG